jgi:GTP:adenosylcobinamide-phosphate guanylyltransferase
MCVVDRRNDGAHAPPVDFAQVQEALMNHVDAGSAEVDDFSSMVPAASVDESSRRVKQDEPGGVTVVEGTPGPEALVQLMLKRVWNVDVTKESLATDQLLV